MNTVILFAAVFASKTLGFTATEIIGLFLVVQISALIGSALWARPTDTRGPRFVVTVTLVQWAAVTVLSFFVQAKWEFWLVAVLAGTGLGAVQAASRTFMATLIPAGREAEFFGFYSLVGKTGAVMGPFVFGLVSWLMSGKPAGRHPGHRTLLRGGPGTALARTGRRADSGMGGATGPPTPPGRRGTRRSVAP